MTLCGVVRGLTRLGVDAAEALLFLFDWSTPAHEIWADARKPADKEAEEEVAKPDPLLRSRHMLESLSKAVDKMISDVHRGYSIPLAAAAAAGMVDGLQGTPWMTTALTFTGLSSSPAPASAGDIRPPCSAPIPDVEQGGLPNLTKGELRRIAGLGRWFVLAHCGENLPELQFWNDLADKCQSSADAMK